MAKRKKKGIKIIDIIVLITIMIISIIIIKNIMKNKSKEQEDMQTSGIQAEQQEKYTKILEDKTKLNTSEKLKEDKKFEELKVKDIQLTYKDGVTNLLATIENTTQTKIEMQNVEIVLLDEKGEELYKMPGIIEEIEAGKTTQLNCSVTADFSNVYDFRITKNSKK